MSACRGSPEICTLTSPGKNRVSCCWTSNPNREQRAPASSHRLVITLARLESNPHHPVVPLDGIEPSSPRLQRGAVTRSAGGAKERACYQLHQHGVAVKIGLEPTSPSLVRDQGLEP